VTTTFTVAEVTDVLTQPVVVFVTTHVALRGPAAFAVFRVMKLSPTPPPVVDTTSAPPENVHAYDGVPPFTRPLTVNVKLPPPQSVPDGGVIVNDGSGWIETVYVSTDAQPPTVYSCVMLPVEPEPHVMSNVPPVPVPVTWLPTIESGAVAAERPEFPDTLIVCEPAPATVYVAVVPAHGAAAPIPAPVMLKSPATGDAVTVTAIDVVA
jgi:hypothetical protein